MQQGAPQLHLGAGGRQEETPRNMLSLPGGLPVSLTSAVMREIWAALTRIAHRLEVLEQRVETIDARIRARLKEEAESREEAYWEHDTPHTKKAFEER